jgi:hypothetical protein
MAGAAIGDGRRAMSADAQRDEAAPVGETRIEREDDDRVVRIVATAEEPRPALLAGLRGILAVATGRDDEPPADDVAIAAPIQGRGADLAALFEALADDLLDQLAAMGSGFGRVRLDGLLRTDDGGWTAWGYLLGRPNGGAIGSLTRRGPVALERDDHGRLVVRCALERRP